MFSWVLSTPLRWGGKNELGLEKLLELDKVIAMVLKIALIFS